MFTAIVECMGNKPHGRDFALFTEWYIFPPLLRLEAFGFPVVRPAGYRPKYFTTASLPDWTWSFSYTECRCRWTVPQLMKSCSAISL